MNFIPALLALFLSLPVLAFDKVPLTGKLYIPGGYDDNDLVEVMVNGSLPDLCHRSPGYTVVREGNHFLIQMYAYYVPNPEGCGNLSVPYTENVRLGILPYGEYSASVEGAINASIDKFKVRKAVSALQDDYIYGNVMGIKENDASREIELIGTNPVNCLKFHKLTADVQDKVIVLRPLFKQEGVCEDVPTSFVLNYKVPYLKKHPKGILLHVRIMDGRSYNYLYQNRL